MNYRQRQHGQGWEADWINWAIPYSYAKKVDGLGGVRWEIVKTAPYTLEGLQSLVDRWEAEGRQGAVIYDGHFEGFPVPWVARALKGNQNHAPDHTRGALYGTNRLAFDHNEKNPLYGFDHSHQIKHKGKAA